ncbi:tRNA preQ1(34) S-adenosylmethionine ribosyltransferase-isomerase QueA [Miniphocaeibacter halophilus]|uniref:tRNA preQ1(34) S-adenosylmethionine ribosyltransferase-isomerase QueA n=1 Tax=Miniphocaeibacter halophilus TaxID=2931922 RepID=A0AC61MQ52_9FIRM|nr:tRNA preQ1(34) S-adenosylmethionine ribosyltransferase-isomerase QueA [Miniphocaeibacter halophilus]QQK07805.1 tRNA preQ1(34) S-adenosylmethionine ribosyltransferase-isomerase QueA [Miniphocaeibacter halophilus]
MRTDDFNFDLNEELIAQFPIENRDQSRLLVMGKESGKIEHKYFYNIIDYLNKGDVLVLNDTRVLPARLFGNRPGKDEKIEVLLLKKTLDNSWECLVKPGKKMKIDTIVEFGKGLLKGRVMDIKEDGSRIVKFIYDGIFEEILDKLGTMPLPPYIKEKLKDKERYQTVYSKHNGSAAAPTAGLHFTKDLLLKIKEKGIKVAYITLHVGLGTFRPVKVDDVEEHIMHSEYYNIPDESSKIINKAIEEKSKIVAVGTTSIRTLETVAKEHGKITATSGWTDIFIYPGFKFKVVDSLITNFHLPKSTLMMLVSAFSTKENIMNAYKLAIKEKYRFFSFGDAMLINKEENI